MKKVFVSVLLSLGFILTSGPVYAQRAEGSVTGSVTDASHAAVPGAIVVVHSLEMGTERQTVTDTAGFYAVTALPAGRYSMRVTQKGFATFVVPELVIQVDQQATVNAELSVGAVSQTVAVQGTPVAVETREGTLSTSINQKMVTDLPLNGRNLMQLLTVTPGTLNTMNGTSNWADGIYAGGTFDQQATRPEAGSVLVSTSGGHGDSTTFILDGGLHEDPYSEVANVLPNPDAVEEFTFETNSYSAKFGGRGGGVVNIVTRSGQNALHGSVFEYLRNSDLNATNFFTPGHPDGLKRNQYGFSLGGPIKRDKTFFFGSYEGTQFDAAPANSTAIVPTAAEREGNWSSSTKHLVDPRTGVALTGNIIPTASLDAAAQNFLKLIPVATASSGLINYTTKTDYGDNQFITKVDHHFSEKSFISGRYFFDNLFQPSLADPNNSLTGLAETSKLWRSQGALVNYTYVLSPTLLTNTTFNYDRVAHIAHASPVFPTQDAFGINVLNLAHGPEIRTVINNYFTVRYNNLYRLPRDEWNLQHSWTWVHGRHEIQWGFDGVREHFILDQDYESVGRFDFSSALSGDNMVDFLFGAPSDFIQITPTYNVLTRNLYGGYVQDNFKVNRRLTLNLGLRWNPFLEFTNADDIVSVFSQTAYAAGVHSTRYPNLGPGQLLGGDTGVPSAGVKPRYALFDPRVGFAYDLFGNGRTSIRMGYGRYQDQLSAYSYNLPGQAPPGAVMVDFTAPASYENPYQGQVDPFPVTRPWPSNYNFPEPYKFSAFDPNFGYPSIHQWNFTVEQKFGQSMVLRAAYVGSLGNDLFLSAEDNAAVYGPGATRTNTNSRRPRQQFLNIIFTGTYGQSHYNALVLSLERRLATGLTFLAGYTWQRSLDDVSASVAGGASTDTTHPVGQISKDYGPSDFNRTSTFVASFNYHLPSPQSRLRYALGGWRTNGIINLMDGQPFTVSSGIDNSYSGIGADRADIVGNPIISGSRSRGAVVAEWFNTAAFTTNAAGTFGSVGRNTLSAPGFTGVDFSLFKEFHMPFEGHKLEFRAEAFNVFNFVNLSPPTATQSSGTFGRITSAYDPRILQLGLRYTF